MPLPPLSLYVHIPWCVRKCPYCDFNSHESKRIPEQEYVHALLNDLQKDQHLAQNRPLQSIFFGGGTPSLFSARSIATIIDSAQNQIGFSSDIEITLETNPGTAEYHNLQGYRAAGVNRLSFGVQSFNDGHLKRLGRIHNSSEVFTAFDQARAVGFTNINLDLMHGLPQQTLAEAMADLTYAIDLGVEHISWYQLTIEPNTVFYNRPPKLPNDDALTDIQEAGQTLLAQQQYQQYEISAYSRAEQAKHNLNYWQFGDYLAIGAGAHGKITQSNKQIDRYWKTRKPEDYLACKKGYTAGSQAVPVDQQALEFMMNALRLVEGVPRAYLNERCQIDETTIQTTLRQLVQKGLLRANPLRFQTTPLGLRFLNDLLDHFNDS